MQQPGINQFNGTLRRLGVRGKELSGRSLQEVYGSPLPPRENAAARLAVFRGRVPAGGGEAGKNEEHFETPVAHRPRPLATAAAAKPDK